MNLVPYYAPRNRTGGGLRSMPRMRYNAPVGVARSLKRARSYTMTDVTRRQRPSTNFVTAQKDSRLIYRYKRMPRYKRRRWVKAVRRNLAMDLKNIGSRTCIRNDSTVMNSATGGQTIQGFHLYGTYSTDSSNELGNGDLYTIMTTDTSSSKATQSLFFSSAVMDLTMTNVSSAVDLNDAPTHPALEVDIYDCVWRKEDAGNHADVFSLFSQALTATELLPSTGAAKYSPVSRGFTPFDVVQANKESGMKILKKTKFFIPYLDSITYQIRDPKNRKFNRRDIENQASFIGPKGCTRTLIIIMKPVTGFPSLTVGTLSVGATRKYQYKVMENNTDYQGLL